MSIIDKIESLISIQNMVVINEPSNYDIFTGEKLYFQKNTMPSLYL